MTIKAVSTNYKALQVNLESNMYGTFAEIGAGQEVARYFFQVGGASQTVAKSISAYDMTFSDEIYGKEPSGRYVCQSRLLKMLSYEYELLVQRLQTKRGKNTRFFVLANTVSTKNHFSNNDGHGWIGLRFQVSPEGTTNDIIVHVRLLDDLPLAQQEALGILGVNIVHAATFQYDNAEKLCELLMENLTNQRVELNMIALNGNIFKKVDNRLLNLELVKLGLTNAVLFDEHAQVVLAADVLYKKTVQVVRGSFRPPTKVNLDMIQCGLKKFSQDLNKKPDEIFSICEITMHNLNSSGFDSSDFIARVELLAALKQKVLISNFPQYYRLVNYFNDLKAQHMALILGGYNFKQIFDENYNQEAGGFFAALGQLFKENVRVYVYPYKDERDGVSIDLDHLQVPDKLQYLLKYLIQNSSLIPITEFDEKNLHIYSRRVLNMIQKKESGWESMVPAEVTALIQQHHYFMS